MKIYNNPLKQDWAPLLQRAVQHDDEIADRVAKILQRVKLNGDAAIRELSKEIDDVELLELEVSEAEKNEAAQQISEDLKAALNVAYANISKFHEVQKPKNIEVETMSGVHCYQRAVPINRVGLYIPGGNAPLFSTVLMLAIPARVAGCNDVVLCTPPNKQGKVAPAILYTASLCGIKHIYKIGGAQAIAAMAYGTATISKRDKIFGPGNRYVTKAKQLLSVADVAIDMPAGPSEVMVLADDSARAEYVAADMLSQAEHGSDSQAMLVCTSVEIANQVSNCINEQQQLLQRCDSVKNSLSHSKIIVLNNTENIIEFANAYAPEHLIISMREAWKIADKITAAGSVFIGNYSPESAGDYASGTNHTLPTSGWARAYSGVNIDSFMRKITYQELTKDGLENLSKTIITMAQNEGLDAHANAVKIRIKN